MRGGFKGEVLFELSLEKQPGLWEMEKGEAAGVDRAERKQQPPRPGHWSSWSRTWLLTSAFPLQEHSGGNL